MTQIETARGSAEVVRHDAAGASGTLVLTHGAGGDVDAPDLVAVAGTMPPLGWSVLLVRMPWRVAGKKLAPRPAVIDECYSEILEVLHLDGPFVLGGRSAGARSACRIGAGHGASGVLALSFPLHPPGKPERSRLEELTGAGVPALVVQGERDPFGAASEYPQDLSAELVEVPFADHSLKVPKRAPVTQDETSAAVARHVADWLGRLLPGI